MYGHVETLGSLDHRLTETIPRAAPVMEGIEELFNVTTFDSGPLLRQAHEM
jgi:hypothetical protein